MNIKFKQNLDFIPATPFEDIPNAKSPMAAPRTRSARSRFMTRVSTGVVFVLIGIAIIAAGCKKGSNCVIPAGFSYSGINKSPKSDQCDEERATVEQNKIDSVQYGIYFQTIVDSATTDPTNIADNIYCPIFNYVSCATLWDSIVRHKVVIGGWIDAYAPDPLPWNNENLT